MLGDSKSADNALNPWRPILTASLLGGNHFDRIVSNADLAVSGWTTTSLKNAVDGWIASHTAIMPPQYILINIGANNWTASDVTYTLDALHAQWPAAQMLIAGVWSRANGQQVSAAMIATVTTGRTAWANMGPDEGIFLEGGDNGVLETYDGQHYSSYGAQQAAAAWQVSMGF